MKIIVTMHKANRPAIGRVGALPSSLPVFFSPQGCARLVRMTTRFATSSNRLQLQRNESVMLSTNVHATSDACAVYTTKCRQNAR
jgi:hypothetical protein